MYKCTDCDEDIEAQMSTPKDRHTHTQLEYRYQRRIQPNVEHLINRKEKNSSLQRHTNSGLVK